MSDEKRKILRTQGRYSDGNLPKIRDRKQKVSPDAKDSSESRLSKRHSDGNKAKNSSLSETDISVKYEENSDYTFNQLDEVVKPEEIKGRGEKILSKTENGESRIHYNPEFLHEDESNAYFDEIYNSVEWNEKNIVINGVEYPQPRLVAWFGPYPYSYSGTTLEPAEMPEVVKLIKEKIETYLKYSGIDATFNSVLINLYRDGKDSVAWHSDDEITLGISPTIASVSLGETRKFEIRPKVKSYNNESPSNQSCKYLIHLTHGSLLVMTGSMQDDWQHRIPKEYHDKEPRINLTFRTVYPLEKAPAKESNQGTVKNQFYSSNSSNKTSGRKYQLDDKQFPPLNNDTNCAKSKVSNDAYNKPKYPNSDIKKDDTVEEYWDDEMSCNEQKTETIVTHKNNYLVSENENCKDKNNRETNFNSKNPPFPRQWHNIESDYSLSDNDINPSDKDIEKKSWCDESDSMVKQNKIDQKEFEMKSQKAAYNLSTNQIQENNFCNEIDQKKMYDREKFNIKNSYESITKKENAVKSHDVEINSSVNTPQENYLYKEESTKKNHSVKNNLWINSSAENKLDVKKHAKTGLNVDAKEFVPNYTQSSEVNRYNDVALEKLISCDVNSLSGKDLQDHAQNLKKQVLTSLQYFTRFVREDLEFMCKITDGSQTDKNQRLITLRICRIVQNDLQKNRSSSSFMQGSFEKNSRQRGYENQNYFQDKGKRFHYPNRNSRY